LKSKSAKEMGCVVGGNAGQHLWGHAGVASSGFRGGQYRRGTALRAHGRRADAPTPLKAIRARCLNCRGFEKTAVRECDMAGCALHGLRMDRGARATLKPIRAYCLWCCNSQRSEVRECPARGCPIWSYRLGRRPQTTRLMPEIASTAGCSGRERRTQTHFPIQGEGT
jgi:hypothetical protein